MTGKELKIRSERSQHLRVVQVDGDVYFVESSEGKIAYIVRFNGDEVTCSCGDYSRGVKADSSFRCKHVLSVFNSVPTGSVQAGHVLERARPKLDERWITTIEGKEFVRYPGLLDLGHQKGLAQIEVEAVQLPTPENGNFAVCKATVVSKVGESFVDIGDANPGNCSGKVSKHILRMASTRAIARALRSMTNSGMTCLEELDFSDTAANGSEAAAAKADKRGGDRRHRSQSNRPALKPVNPPAAAGETAPPATGTASGESDQPGLPSSEPTGPEPTPEPARSKKEAVPKVSDAQLRAINNLARRRGISEPDLRQTALSSYGVELEHLASKDASALIRQLQTQ